MGRHGNFAGVVGKSKVTGYVRSIYPPPPPTPRTGSSGVRQEQREKTTEHVTFSVAWNDDVAVSGHSDDDDVLSSPAQIYWRATNQGVQGA